MLMVGCAVAYIAIIYCTLAIVTSLSPSQNAVLAAAAENSFLTSGQARELAISLAVQLAVQLGCAAGRSNNFPSSPNHHRRMIRTRVGIRRRRRALSSPLHPSAFF